MKNTASFLLFSLAFALVFAGCDTTGAGGDTAVLNAESVVPPTVEYEFRYSSENVSNDGQRVEVVSRSSDNLGSVLTQNGFSRSDVVSARVDSVVMIRRSDKDNATAVQPKVFDYLSGAAVFLGTDATGKRIAEAQFSTTEKRVRLGVANADVTEEVKNGSKKAFLRLTTSGDVPQQDVIEVDVFYRIEVGGV